jgi:transcription termination factor Rho
MKEPEDQPSLVEADSETVKPPKRRAAKPKAATTKVKARSAASAKARSRKKAAATAEEAESAPVAEVLETAPASTERSEKQTAAEIKPEPAQEPAPVPAVEAPAAPPAPAPVRQYPVYIPRHVAKQLEESGQPAPVAVTAEVAATMPIVAAAAAAAAAAATAVSAPSAPRPAPPMRSESPMAEPPQPSAVVVEEELGISEGIVEISGKGFGFVRDANKGFSQNPSDIFVTPEIARSYNLRDGQWVKGQTRRGNRGAQLYRLLEVNGEDPEKSRDQPAFDELTVVSPLERFTLETVPDRHTTRIIDLFTPIGKGQRGLIVAPPRTGKTTLLQHIADAVVKNHPETNLIILLVDERPEEVTDIRRTVPTAEIMASSNDMDVKSHTRIAQLAIERAKRLTEAGKDVFILLDSITRVGRAFNNAMAGGGRTMSGGVDARALEIPRRIFAAARNTEEAGSLTIVATALIETGSRMDDLIFQEFKGTGNMELVLDRKISDQRIYPAIDIFLSGTRREELLIPADDLHKIGVIRRGLSGYKPIEAIERLLFFMKKFPTNAEMLKNIPG